MSLLALETCWLLGSALLLGLPSVLPLALSWRGGVRFPARLLLTYSLTLLAWVGWGGSSFATEELVAQGASGASPRKGKSHTVSDLAVVLVGTHSDKCSQQGAEAVSAEEVAAFCLAAQEKLGTYLLRTSISFVRVLRRKGRWFSRDRLWTVCP